MKTLIILALLLLIGVLVNSFVIAPKVEQGWKDADRPLGSIEVLYLSASRFLRFGF